MTFKDLQKLVESQDPSAAKIQRLQRLRDKPFWIWDKAQHKDKDRKSKAILSVLIHTILQHSLVYAQEDNVTATNQTVTTQGFSTYNNPVYGISIEYPSNWEVREEDANNLTFHDPNSSALLFVFVGDAEPTDTIDKAARETMALYTEEFANFQTVSTNKTKLGGEGGIEANQMIFTYSFMSGEQMKHLSIIGIKDGTLYDLSYDKPTDQFDTYLPTIMEMINSFRITGFS